MHNMEQRSIPLYRRGKHSEWGVDTLLIGTSDVVIPFKICAIRREKLQSCRFTSGYVLSLT